MTKVKLLNRGITSVSDNVDRNLQESRLNDNMQSTSPDGMYRLKKLKGLVLEEGSLKSLEKLDLSNTGLSTLPDELYWLVKLNELYLTDNRLTSLSSRITPCVNWRWLI